MRDENGRALGLLAIKIALQDLEREWLQTPDIVLASDAHGVVFLASQDAWRYRLLEPLDDEERRELNATRQYANQPLRPLDYRVGFVTSYADITSYKKAARELRSLAAALEQRVANRTRDLDAARQEAERANRTKTRFVAAAVHDLLQPLNTALMFTSLLRGHLRDAERHAVDSIDGALAAQDAILNSLLDIARMESGQLEVRVRDVALGPLLQVLGHNFGVLAESQGLALRCVPTRAVVRTDENLLRRILQNFVSNAIRYSRHGRIVVGCRREVTAMCASRCMTRARASPRRCSAISLRSSAASTRARAATGARVWAWPLSSAWAACWATRSACARSWGGAACFRCACRWATRPPSSSPSAPPPRRTNTGTTPPCTAAAPGWSRTTAPPAPPPGRCWNAGAARCRWPRRRDTRR